MRQRAVAKYYHSLVKIKKARFILESLECVPKEEILSKYVGTSSKSFEEAFSNYLPRKFYLFKIPWDGRLYDSVGFISEVRDSELVYELYQPIEAEFFDGDIQLHMDDYGIYWFITEEVEFKVDYYREYHWELDSDTLKDHTGVDFKSTGKTYLLAANVPEEGWKEWEVWWIYDKKRNDIHVVTVPDHERFVLDVDYYGEDWFLIPI